MGKIKMPQDKEGQGGGQQGAALENTEEAREITLEAYEEHGRSNLSRIRIVHFRDGVTNEGCKQPY